MIIDDMMHTANALADIALDIARDLRSMNDPRISLDQIRNRIDDYFDAEPLNDLQLAQYARDIASHPAIRNAIR